MFFNKYTIIPAKTLEINKDGDYHLLCYFGFDNIQERVFSGSLFNGFEKADYYLISHKMKNGKLETTILPADEEESIFLKNHYEK